MSKKFTGITSAGSTIPVYDKDAHSALEQKLDTSAFSSVSGDFLTEVPESAVSGFATHEEVESATSGKADRSSVVEYVNVPESGGKIFANGNTFSYVNGIYGSGVSINQSNLYLSGTVTATTGGITAEGLSASNGGSFCIKCAPEVFSGGTLTGFTFSSMNTGFGTAQLTTANPNQIVTIYSPKFEAKNISGAGFSIEGSGARGYDASGNVTWDTTNPPAPTQLIAGSDSPKPSILLSPYIPKNMSAQFSNAPLFSADGNGLYIGISGQYLRENMQGITARNGVFRSEIADSSGAVTGYTQINGDEVSVYHSSAFGSAGSGTWNLTGSVQKREIECDSATSAITAIAGSAIGGKEYSAGANIDITDEVISGKDWSEDIAAATSGLMQTSGLEYDGDKISGYMGSAFAGGGEVPEGVMVESAVEYNAVNEISGYNGSAIAQYGAEKQWLVHDDTLVHAANSAQYALGVNLSAVAQLLGVDETVLYSAGNEQNTTYQLSELPSNFKEIGIYWKGNAIDGGNHLTRYDRIDTNLLADTYVFPGSFWSNGDTFYNCIAFVSGMRTTNWNRWKCGFGVLGATAYDYSRDRWMFITKVIGIGRKN